MAQMTPLATIMNQTPQVSVVMPNLNNRRFLPERLDSIVNQTLTDWEAIIVDSYSDDGAWELIQAYAARDRRFRIAQAPRDGIYPNLNRCIEQARGKYVYIATSDDTMTPECLAKMVTAMDAHPECGLCQTPLTIINEHGQEMPNLWRTFPVCEFFGDWLDVPHIRFAPYDGILHSALYTVYTSLTQLLIRRSVFDKIGGFRNDWGAESDFEWGMRAGLVCHIFYLPERVATWRMHRDQATAQYNPQASVRKARLCDMVHAACTMLKITSSASPNKNIRVSRLTMPYRQEQLLTGLWEQASRWRQYQFLLWFALIRPDIVAQFLLRRICRQPIIFVDRFSYLRSELNRLGLMEQVKFLA